MTEVERIREICRYIERHPDEPLKLESLAAMANTSKFHFARRFKAVVGVTPKEFVNAQRLSRFKNTLKNDGSIDAAAYDAGYGSSSRVYENATRNLGMTPAQYRAAGEGVSISYALLETPVGLMMIGATDRGVCFAHFGDSEKQLREALRREYENATIAPMNTPYHPDFARWVGAIARHLKGERSDLNLPLDIRATAFQMRVWTYLQSIPSGDVASYGEVAAAIGRPKAARAVGNAVAGNMVAVVVPCHRVIRESGALGGYRWGLERKRTLLDIERASRR
jgi:AraC family transcriptional regulator, regulatory protein of adaptative response / methylated-DNA-[protein]-cysteine methyltransferase